MKLKRTRYGLDVEHPKCAKINAWLVEHNACMHAIKTDRGLSFDLSHRLNKQFIKAFPDIRGWAIDCDVKGIND